MTSRLLVAALLLESVAAGSIIGDVRSAIAANDFAQAEASVREYREANGVTPEMLEALSWLGRGALFAGNLNRAEDYAVETQELAAGQLETRSLDAERHLPVALGAAIEVRALVMSERGERSGAVEFLRRELATYRNTSIRARIQKNINLLSLEGKPAPPLEAREWLGPKPAGLDLLKGRPVLLFFWVHWCGECKGEALVVARLLAEYRDEGLAVIAPTQRYGYAAHGMEATPAQELKYIAEIRNRYYAGLLDIPAPVSEEDFKNYGASTTPTLVLLDRQGIVRMYHPGQMSYDDLAARVREVTTSGKP